MRAVVEIKRLKNPNNLECKTCPFGWKTEDHDYICTVAGATNPMSKFICLRGFDPRTIKIVEESDYIEYEDEEIKKKEEI